MSWFPKERETAPQVPLAKSVGKERDWGKHGPQVLKSFD